MHPPTHTYLKAILFSDIQTEIPSFLLEVIYLTGFRHSSVGKESAFNEEEPGLIPRLGRSPGEGKGYPLQCSGLENSMDYIVHGVSGSQT